MYVCIEIYTLQLYITDLTQRGCHTLRLAPKSSLKCKQKFEKFNNHITSKRRSTPHVWILLRAWIYAPVIWFTLCWQKGDRKCVKNLSVNLKQVTTLMRKECGLDYSGPRRNLVGAGEQIPFQYFCTWEKFFGYWVEGKIKKILIFYKHYLGDVKMEEKWKPCVLREAIQNQPSRPFTKEQRLCKFSELFALRWFYIKD